MAAETARYWQHAAVPGVDLLRARFVTHRYSRHAHETFTLGLVEDGVEEFEYGRSLLRAGRGAVALLNPEVVHTARLQGRTAGPTGCSTRRCTWWPASPPRSAGRGRSRCSRRPSCTTSAAPSCCSRPTWPPSAATGSPRPACSGPGSPGCCWPTPSPPGRPLGPPPPTGRPARPAPSAPPPHAYLNQLRVRLARRLLDGGLAPGVVAAEAGFADQAHLTRHFKRVIGVPPGAYQRERTAPGVISTG